MRLWSLHPSYLDRQGLLAVWREGLLAQKVLQNRTKGYKNHPQLLRFRESQNPLEAIGYYLFEIATEAGNRGYSFNFSKIDKRGVSAMSIPVTRGQLQYEKEHLLGKLMIRDTEKIYLIKDIFPLVHPIFFLVEGGVEKWEVVKL